MFEVLEHLLNPHSSLLKIRNLLEDKGILIITVPNFSSFNRIVFGKSWYILGLPRHLSHFTKRTIKGILEKAGFQCLKLMSVSNINHTNLTWGYSETIRFWLREHNLYPSREKAIAYIESHIKSDIPNRISRPLWKKILHKGENILFYPLAKLMDMIGMGENLYICAKKAK